MDGIDSMTITAEGHEPLVITKEDAAAIRGEENEVAEAAAEKAQQAEQQTFPGFEGRSVRGAAIMLAGTVRVEDDIPIVGSYDECVITVKAHVIAVDHHHRGKTGLVREQRLEVDSIETVKITKRGDGVISMRHRNDDIEEGQA